MLSWTRARLCLCFLPWEVTNFHSLTIFLHSHRCHTHYIETPRRLSSGLNILKIKVSIFKMKQEHHLVRIPCFFSKLFQYQCWQQWVFKVLKECKCIPTLHGSPWSLEAKWVNGKGFSLYFSCNHKLIIWQNLSLSLPCQLDWDKSDTKQLVSKEW